MWTAHDPLPDNDRQYGFTLFSMTLNEKDDSKREREREREGGREEEREGGREGEVREMYIHVYSSCTCTTVHVLHIFSQQVYMYVCKQK